MKRFIAVLSGLLVLPAFAEVAPIYYDEVIEYSDMDTDADYDAATDETNAAAQQNLPSVAAPVATSPRNTAGRTASRAIASSVGQPVAPARNVTTRGTTARNAQTARTAVVTPTASRATTARATVARATTTGNNNATITPRRTTNTSGTTVARASIQQTDTVNNPLYIGRVGVRSSTGVTSRVPTIRTTSSPVISSDTSSTTSDIDELAQMTDFCKAQYMQCMDNYCNVLDDNQGRCSCSKNLKNYANTEAALQKATEELQDVAQKIQYIGLSSDEVETLFTQTEAELQMQKTSDSTQLRNDLDRIKGMIVNVKSGTASSTSDSGISLDLSGLMDFTISSTGFDLSSLFGGSNSNTSTISNQRGEQLYKTATARCKSSVLNSCAAQGVDIAVISNSYDLEIDKQCLVYERSLSEANTQMASTVRNAKSVLQKARLMVAQQKNQYDLRGCINALDSCMQDDYVCGSDYENCLDPTGQYIVNGTVVNGSMPGRSGIVQSSGAIGKGLYKFWNYKDTNVWTNGDLAAYINEKVTDNSPTSSVNDMADYLRAKIGYTENGKQYGMCASVLDKCQAITYTGSNANNKKFKFNNDVIKEYLQRTMIQIKAKQDEVLADYADDCLSNVNTCLAQNNYNYSLSATKTSTTNLPSDIAINACLAQINTCRSVTEGTTDTVNTQDAKVWLDRALQATYGALAAKCTSLGGTLLPETPYCGVKYDTSNTYYANLNDDGKLYTLDTSNNTVTAVTDSATFTNAPGFAKWVETDEKGVYVLNQASMLWAHTTPLSPSNVTLGSTPTNYELELADTAQKDLGLVKMKTSPTPCSDDSLTDAENKVYGLKSVSISRNNICHIYKK